MYLSFQHRHVLIAEQPATSNLFRQQPLSPWPSRSRSLSLPLPLLSLLSLILAPFLTHTPRNSLFHVTLTYSHDSVSLSRFLLSPNPLLSQTNVPLDFLSPLHTKTHPLSLSLPHAYAWSYFEPVNIKT